MPKNSHMAVSLICQFHHQKQQHQGYGMTHNAIRQAGYYIINGHSMVSHIIAKCVICRKLRVCTQNQNWQIYLLSVSHQLLHSPILGWMYLVPSTTKKDEKN